MSMKYDSESMVTSRWNPNRPYSDLPCLSPGGESTIRDLLTNWDVVFCAAPVPEPFMVP